MTKATVPPRILLLITDLEIGGTPTVVRELAIRLRHHNWAHVEVACLGRWGPVADQLKEAGVPVTSFNAATPRDLPAALHKLLYLIRSRRFDTVFSFLIHANTLAALAAPFCKSVRFLQSVQTTQPNPRWHWHLQSIVQYAADSIVVPSPSAAAAARDWANVPDHKIVIIPNAVDLEPLPATRPMAHRIGFIGRLDPIKRVPDLLAALTHLDPGYTLHIFGDGPARPRIESTIDDLHLRQRVHLHGTIPHPRQALESIDLLVLPSSAEGFGLVLIEAMAAGIPIVATNVPGIRDVITDNSNGLLVPAYSPDCLARAIKQISEDPNLRTRLTARATEDVRTHFSWDVVLPRYQNLLGT